MNPENKNEKVEIQNGRTRAQAREAKKKQRLSILYQGTPIPTPLEDQVWMTPEYSDSRQVTRRTARLTRKKELGTQKRQSRRDAKAALKERKRSGTQVQETPSVE